jgi:hypothetical protein
MLRSILIASSLSLVTLAGLGCDPAPADPTMSRARELAAALLEESPDVAVLSIDGDRIVAVDDECVEVDAALYCIAGDDTDASAPQSLTTPEPDPEALMNNGCYLIDGYTYCDEGGGGGGCVDFECGQCVRRASSYTGWAEWCGCLGWVACEP